MRILMKFKKAFFGWGPLLALTVMMGACLGNSTPSTFYMLKPIEGASPEKASDLKGIKSVSVLLGPISLPGYLDRNQMVTVPGNNEVALDEFNRWAESLQDGFYRVLQEDLSTLLGTPAVYRYDRGNINAADYHVMIDVTRFDAVSGGDAVLKAFWTLTGKNIDKAGVTRRFVFRTPVSGTGFPAIVDAQNETISVFSREIAKAITSLES